MAPCAQDSVSIWGLPWGRSPHAVESTRSYRSLHGLSLLLSPLPLASGPGASKGSNSQPQTHLQRWAAACGASVSMSAMSCSLWVFCCDLAGHLNICLAGLLTGVLSSPCSQVISQHFFLTHLFDLMHCSSVQLTRDQSF